MKQAEGSVLGSRKTLSVMPTFACTAACRHCGTMSSPKAREHLSSRTITDAISQANRLAFSNVVFTGGEATIRPDVLTDAIRHAHTLGLDTRLVTNAHWAATEQMATEFITALRSAGLDELNVSTGDEHVRFVPLDNVVHAVAASCAAAMSISIMIELHGEAKILRDEVERRVKDRVGLRAFASLVNVIESPWMPLSPHRTRSYPEGTAITRQNVASCKGCDSILQTYVLQADGRIGACCGLGMRLIPELNVGHIGTADALASAIEEAESDLLKYAIRYFGTEKLLAWAASKNDQISWEGMYAHRCQACQRLYRDPVVRGTMRRHFSELMADVIFSAWLEERYLPAQPAFSRT